MGVIRHLLSKLGLDEGGQAQVIQSLDKGDLDEVRKRTDADFMKVVNVKGSSTAVGPLRGVWSDPVLEAMFDEFSATLRLLDENQVSYMVDFSMARGLDYYTGVVFDAKVEGLGAQDQVMGGGRYDKLVGLFGGPDTAAVGFAFGLDRLIESMQQQAVAMPAMRTDVFVAAVSDSIRDKAFKVALDLRRRRPGLIVEYGLADRKLNKAIQHALDIGARYVVLVGERELSEGGVVLKDMDAQTQETVRIEELPRLIKVDG
jgi:histidyl-tRNA synthetase